MADIRAWLALAVDAAHHAGEIQRKGLGGHIGIAYKGPKDLVTDIDRECEQAVFTRIHSAYPDHSIMSEEGSNLAFPSPFRWIIDPLDGTTNYTHAYPCFCVSIGLEAEGSVVLGVVYDPILDELFTAVKGEGARLNGNPIHVSGTATLERALVATGRMTKGRGNSDTQFSQFKRMAVEVQATRMDGSASLDLCYVAAGRYDGFWEFGLKPWDTTAGSLIVEEAGGRVTTYDAGSFDPFKDELLCSNGLVHQAMIDILRDTPP
ncbi:MAG: inositol monophosphatase family protein [bacterium]